MTQDDIALYKDKYLKVAYAHSKEAHGDPNMIDPACAECKRIATQMINAMGITIEQVIENSRDLAKVPSHYQRVANIALEMFDQGTSAWD